MLKSKNNSEALEDYKNANEFFENGDYQECLRTLSFGFQKDVNFKALYELAEKSLLKLDAKEEADLFKKARKSFNSFHAFNNLGLHFYDVGLYDLALPFLKRAVELDSSNLDTVHDLSIVYARRFNIKEAIEVLENNNPKSYFWNYWFLTKLKILNNQRDGIQNDINELFEILNNEPNDDALVFPFQKVNEVQEIFDRLSIVSKPKNHIRDWHFIQYGNMILDFFEDSEEYVAGGRYVAAWGSNESIKKIASKLSFYLDKFNKKFEKVLYLNDRNSKIIALVIANELNIDAKIYNNEVDSKNSIIVATNSTYFNGMDELEYIETNQVLFALNHFWLDSAQISPDICGFMTQMYSFPWSGEGLKVVELEDGSKKTEKIPPDTREESVIADEISKLTCNTFEEDEDLTFYLKHKDYLKGLGNKTRVDRYNFMIESPVTGSFFV